jgi:hypothetical protein
MLSIVTEIVDIVVVAAAAAAAAAALAIAELIDRIVALMEVLWHDNDVAVALCYNLFLVLGDTKVDYSVYCDLQGTMMVNY